MINGRSLYSFNFRRRMGDPQQGFGVRSFLAFCSTKVVRGGPRALVQLTTCVVALVLVWKLLPHDATEGYYGRWTWKNPWSGDEAQDSVDDSDGSVPGGLRIVVFGENDIATSPNGVRDLDNRSWTGVLCEELDCSSYLSFVPATDNPNHVMASTKLYASSVERALNLTFEGPGPGYDYNFMLDEFPIEWKVSDFSKQVDEFLLMKKPRHPPAETLWVLSFGMWDIWSLASEPLGVSKGIVDSAVEHIFEEVERLYASAVDETSIAWSDPTVERTTAKPSDGLPTPTLDPGTNEPWIKERGPDGEGSDEKAGSGNETKPSPGPRKQFRIVIPKLLDPSLTPGWTTARPETPVVHSKAEQMRNAAALTQKWNDKLAREMGNWLKIEERLQAAAKIVQLDTTAAPATVEGKTAVEVVNGKMSGSQTYAAQRQRAKVAAAAAGAPIGGQNHVARPPPTNSNDADGVSEPEQREAPVTNTDTAVDPEPGRPQRDGVLYDMTQYIEEAMAQRQLLNTGLREARKSEKPTEGGFLEVREPCVRAGSKASPTEAAETAEPSGQAGGAVAEADVPHQRKRSVGPALRGRTPRPEEGAASEGDAPPAEGLPPAEHAPEASNAGAAICEDPNKYLFYTPFSVSSRAVAAIARQAADILKNKDMVRSGWVAVSTPSAK